jgi:hypothetical protein
VRTHVNPAVTANVIVLPVLDGVVQNDPAQDVCKIALVERHRGAGTVQPGFAHGFGLQGRCAIVSTVAHDSHQMLVVGTDDEQMALAANAVAEIGGGMLVMRDGAVLAAVELPIAGLMSDERAEIVAAKADNLLAAYRACGCNLHNANMQLSLLALVVIPELRISDLGLVDVTQPAFIPLLASTHILTSNRTLLRAHEFMVRHLLCPSDCEPDAGRGAGPGCDGIAGAPGLATESPGHRTCARSSRACTPAWRRRTHWSPRPRS